MLGKELVAASTIPLILTILLEGENYGYQLIKKVKEASGGQLQWSDAMLYPVLGRMSKDGLIKSRWELLENGRRRKYYKITPMGLQKLQEKQEDWTIILQMFSKMWNINYSA